LLSYLVEDNKLDVVCFIDSADYNLNYERGQRLHSYSNRIVVSAKMMKNEQSPELAIATHFISIQRLDTLEMEVVEETF
jgi:hypothetical protein